MASDGHSQISKPAMVAGRAWRRGLGRLSPCPRMAVLRVSRRQDDDLASKTRVQGACGLLGHRIRSNGDTSSSAACAGERQSRQDSGETRKGPQSCQAACRFCADMCVTEGGEDLDGATGHRVEVRPGMKNGRRGAVKQGRSGRDCGGEAQPAVWQWSSGAPRLERAGRRRWHKLQRASILWGQAL